MTTKMYINKKQAIAVLKILGDVALPFMIKYLAILHELIMDVYSCDGQASAVFRLP